MEWEGRQLTYHTNLDNTVRTNYAYNSEGIRTYKRVIDLTSGVEYNTYDYTLDGTKILAQRYRNNKTKEDYYLYFIYDETGSVTGFNDGTNTYFYQKNIQGDIIRILDVNGNVVVEYTYDAWGKILSVTGTLADTIGQKNPFRYRSYYYDVDTGWYYLNSRYYDPEAGRFINADSIIGANTELQGYNLFAYCSNNPVIYSDTNGKYNQDTVREIQRNALMQGDFERPDPCKYSIDIYIYAIERLLDSGTTCIWNNYLAYYFECVEGTQINDEEELESYVVAYSEHRKKLLPKEINMRKQMHDDKKNKQNPIILIKNGIRTIRKWKL